MRHVLLLLICGAWFAPAAAAQDAPTAAPQRFALLGDVRLASGETLADCRLGYRTFGTLNGDRSNAVLVPSWFSGSAADIEGLVGPGRLLDPTHDFIIAVDSLGNGISTSPSNSPAQPRMRFPRLTIRDMVDTSHQLVTRVLGVSRLKAVVGISMGGMQAFEWMTAYPGFASAIVPIVGSPRLAPYDLVLWQAQNDAIRSDPAWRGGEYTEPPARRLRFAFGQLLFTTPERYNETTRRDEALAALDAGAQGTFFDAANFVRQSEAMMTHDIFAPFGGSVERAAAAVRARVLVVVSATDHVVTPGPARDFAKAIGAAVVELGGNCGHVAFTCEGAVLQRAVGAFLSR